jgi:hypothetical protein
MAIGEFMNMSRHEHSLWNWASAAPNVAECRVLGANADVALSGVGVELRSQ